MTWQVGPTILTCQLTGRWHGMLTSRLQHVDIILGMPTVHTDVAIMPCWRHPYLGQPRGSGQLVFGSSQPIRAKKTRVTCGVRLCAWPATSPARVAVFDVRFRCGFHQWLRLFLLYTLVWSKHNFDNFHFWAKIKHHFKPYVLIPIIGDSAPPVE